ncbi:hypothetical protein N9C70_02230 [Flavobacteriales bacterium]|jgi:hypothetical protein|nr:hypothetical protein [Flavobacteriales bacterium]
MKILSIPQPLLFCLFISMASGLHAQTTAIPDPAFEQALIDLGFDSGEPDGMAQNLFLESIILLDIPDLGIEDLTGIEACTSLERLYCQDNNLSSIDLSNNPYLWRLYISDNQLDSLDLSNHSYLEYVSSSSNNLSYLNLENCPALRVLFSRYNPLGALDVSGHPNLELLVCNANALSVLNVDANPALEGLHCGDNQLTSLVLDNHPHLEFLSCSNNQLTSLSLHSSPLIEELECANNQLSCLNLNPGSALYLETDDDKFMAQGNPDLFCVSIFNPETAEQYLSPFFDNAVTFTTDCGDGCSVTSMGSISNTPAPNVIGTYDLLGRPCAMRSSSLLIQRLDNGQVRKMCAAE